MESEASPRIDHQTRMASPNSETKNNNNINKNNYNKEFILENH